MSSQPPTNRRKKTPAAPRWGDTANAEEIFQQRRDAVVRTAARAFNETGYYNTTLDEVARRLNVTKPSLYYYVKDKDQILFECNRMAYTFMQGALDEAEHGLQNGLDKLRDFIRAYANLMSNDFGACLIRTGMQPLRPESRAKLRPFAKRLDTALRLILQQGIEDGSIRECHPKLTSNAIFGSLNSLAHWYQPSGEFTPDDICDHFLKLYLEGLKPPRRRRPSPPGGPS